MSSDPKRASGGVAFEVEVETNGDGATTPRGSMPKHITDRLVEAERPTTPDTIQKKQQLAEERRKDNVSMRINKIHAHHERVNRLSQGAQERKQSPGEES